MKIAVVVGTRPEIIKMSPVIKELARTSGDYFILCTGQHYSYKLDKIFFEHLGLPDANYNLDVGSGSHAQQTGNILMGVEDILQRECPDVVLIEGDTNSVIASALAASKLHIKVGHIEAGLRSYDRRMPEEINRILTDHCSDFLFAPTKKAEAILQGEGIPNDKIFVTGNTIVDAVCQNLKSRKSILGRLGLISKKYFLVTVHRAENVDNPLVFASILEGLHKVFAEFQFPIIYPIHPRSRKMMLEFALNGCGITLIEPTDFVDFLQLERNAKLILTDSGGVQEESCILKIPCVTLRDNTERPETIEIEANILAGTSADRILDCVQVMLGERKSWVNPFGDGNAAKKIVGILAKVS